MKCNPFQVCYESRYQLHTRFEYIVLMNCWFFFVLDVLQTSRGFLSVGHLFRSDTGISLVAESLHQIAVIRYALCRNLLILQQILIDSSDLPIDTLEYIRSDCMPETVVFVQAYYVMVWICETSETLPTTGNL